MPGKCIGTSVSKIRECGSQVACPAEIPRYMDQRLVIDRGLHHPVEQHIKPAGVAGKIDWHMVSQLVSPA